MSSKGQLRMNRSLTHGITTAALLASMLAAAPRADAAILLVGWYDFANSAGTVYDADSQVLAGSISTNASKSGTRQSTDGTYGTFAGASTSTDASLQIREDTPLTFSITNNTGQPYSLEGFHFDYARYRNNASNIGPSEFTLTYINGGLSPDNTQIANVTGVAVHFQATTVSTLAISDYPDFDFDLSAVLSGTQLDPGESATFVLTWAGASNPSNNGFVDNIAITGTLIPEPVTLALLIAGGALLMSSRRSSTGSPKCFSH